MAIKNLTYLILLLIYMILPVILASQKKIRFLFRLRYLLPATVFGVAVFVMWDKRFTELGIWSFNPHYITGINLLDVPVEEWLSFIIIPWSAAYIYEWLKIRYASFEQANVFVIVSLLLFVALSVMTYVFRSRIFSFFTFFLTAIYLGYTVFRNRFKSYFTKFYLAFFITLIPFFAVSFILNKLTVILYDGNQIIGTNILGAPVEKIVFVFLLLLINISIYEYLSTRRYF